MIIEPIWAHWWVWAVVALILVGAELLVPIYIALGFAIGAALTALIVAFDLPGAKLGWTLLIYAVLSVGSWAWIYRTYGTPFGKVKRFTEDINEMPLKTAYRSKDDQDSALNKKDGDKPS